MCRLVPCLCFVDLPSLVQKIETVLCVLPQCHPANLAVGKRPLLSFFFLIHFGNLLIDAYKPLLGKVIIDIVGFRTTISLFVLYLSHTFFIPLISFPDFFEVSHFLVFSFNSSTDFLHTYTHTFLHCFSPSVSSRYYHVYP